MRDIIRCAVIHIYKAQLESTQDELKKHAQKYPHGTFLCAGFQTKGHGQFERIWESEADQNILCSLLLKHRTSNKDIQFQVSSIMMSILKDFNIESTFKSPNDIMIDEKKICGIIVDQLFEGEMLQATIIGIGLNVNQTSFQLQTATSMKIVSNLDYNIEEIKTHIYDKLKRFI